MTDSHRLNKSEWEVRPVALRIAQDMVRLYHYAQGGSNTGTYIHGLFKRGEIFDVNCQGVAWWIPPTRTAANSTYPANWKGVLSLSRLVILPGVPANACSFLLSRSMKLINRDKYPCLVTYADTWRGHDGHIYLAANWTQWPDTKPEAVYTLNGRMVARKAGPKTRTKQEMLDMGCVCVGKFSKHKFVHIKGV